MGASQLNHERSEFIEFVSSSVRQTMRLGAALSQVAVLGDVVALCGQLGAGKTQFVRGFAGGFGADERLVSSPTFVLMNEYRGRLPLVHIDAYRMQHFSDVESIGWSSELLDNSVTLVEWADRLGHEMPADRLQIAFEHAGDERRRIVISSQGRWKLRLGEVRRIVKQLSAEHACPVCGKKVGEPTATFPFCSSRCKLVDLNKWFKGDYGIAAGEDEQDDSSKPGDPETE